MTTDSSQKDNSTDHTYKRDQVVEIINSVLGKIQPPQGNSQSHLAEGLNDLKDIIEGLRTQLHEANAHEIGNTHIPSAADELDAVLSTTAEATNTIMQSCENILGIMKGQEEKIFGEVENNIVQIFEACTFQDITGQRIQKVAACLKQIDAKTTSILSVLKVEDLATDTPDNKEKELLNGPALPQNAMTQEEIDKLLADFD